MNYKLLQFEKDVDEGKKTQNSKPDKIVREFDNKKSKKFQDFNFEFNLRIFMLRFKKKSAWVVKVLKFVEKKKQFDEEIEVKIR